ncbi:DegV family protein [Corynebacterium sp. H113]|uniref:DegV family protein n=1 Tax=Corynebacterium sp. H113 TaxID=3133419 RepID=UPI0030B66E93
MSVKKRSKNKKRVQIVVDESACLEPKVAKKNGIFVVPLEVLQSETEMSTSAASPLHLCATYARALERGNDAGVVALHVSKGLSATWSNAVTAASVLDNVRVVDTSTSGAGVGAVVGAAAIRAAKVAAAGGTLDECQAAAEDMLASSDLWLYVPKLEPLRRGGRISTGQAVLSTALAIRPVVGFVNGALTLVAKCRTELKVKERLVQFAVDTVASSTAALDENGEIPAPHILLHHCDALDDVVELQAMLELVMPRGTRYKIVDLPPSLVVHTGLGAYALGIIVDGHKVDDDAVDDLDMDEAVNRAVQGVVNGEAPRGTIPTKDGEPVFTAVTSKLPTWSANRRRAIEKADQLSKAIADLTRRDTSDPEGAKFGATSGGVENARGRNGDEVVEDAIERGTVEGESAAGGTTTNDNDTLDQP